MSARRRPKRKLRSTKMSGNEESQEASALQCLDNFGLDFDCAVAVWLQELREMTNEIVQFLNILAMEYGCVSRCYKFSLRTKRIGIIFLFEDSIRAIDFCVPLCDLMSPHGGYPFKSEHLGHYLRIVADIEQQLDSDQDGGEVDVRIVVRNLIPQSKVTKRVVQLCSVFGNIRQYEIFQDVGQNFEFRHVLVSYKYAVQAFAAKLGLDGKWIAEQSHPLAVEVLRTNKVKTIYQELLKRNKMLFQP